MTRRGGCRAAVPTAPFWAGPRSRSATGTCLAPLSAANPRRDTTRRRHRPQPFLGARRRRGPLRARRHRCERRPTHQRRLLRAKPRPAPLWGLKAFNSSPASASVTARHLPRPAAKPPLPYSNFAGRGQRGPDAERMEAADADAPRDARWQR